MSTVHDNATPGEKGDMPFGSGNQLGGNGTNFAPMNEKEAESQRRSSTILPDGRKMSRIGPPPGMLHPPGSDDDSGDDIGRLVELEAENAIKYRTCSWQKVNLNPC